MALSSGGAAGSREFTEHGKYVEFDGSGGQIRWRKIALLGRGGFGDVCKVITDRDSTCVCAAKYIKVPFQKDEQEELKDTKMRKLIQGELNCCKLKHPNIVRFLYAATQEDFTIVIFMELLEGKTLESMCRNSPMNEADIRCYLSQICSALEYMHSQEPPVIHRDIKGGNIVVLSDRLAKLIDFGLSKKLLDSVSHFTGTAYSPEGTRNFMAPELFDLEKIIYSRESDIWALGCTVYQMATGTVPYAHCQSMGQISNVIEKYGAPQLPDRCSRLQKQFYQDCVANRRVDRKPAAELLRHRFLSSADEQHRGFYRRTSPQGICLIINIDRYDQNSGFIDRDGSEHDVARIEALFRKLDFTVNLRNDLKGDEISHCLQKMAQKDHSQLGAFVCFLMAHGTNKGIFGSDGVHQRLTDLATPFQSHNCPSLANKPKIFFVQACRGGREVSKKADVAKRKTDSAKPVRDLWDDSIDQQSVTGEATLRDFCQSQSDFLFCYASSEDAPAYRDPDNGSLFIQILCDVIEAEHMDEHLVDMMTEVNRQVTNNPVTVVSKKGKDMYFHTVTDMHSQLTRRISLVPVRH